MFGGDTSLNGTNRVIAGKTQTGINVGVRDSF